jgi:polyphosphate kinase
VLTADPAIGEDLTDLFNALTGYSRQTSYQNLLVRFGVRRGIIRRIEDEIEAHREGKDARIRSR